jgi:hypothetical protein
VLEQRVFEWVAAHLIHQNAKAYSDEHAGCMYLDENGRKCAVGALITAENYDPTFEGIYGMAASAAPVRAALSRSLSVPVENLPGTVFLHELQRLHDDASPEDWPAELVEFARNYNLAAPGWLMKRVPACA